MASVREHRPRLWLSEPAPRGRSVGMSVALLVAVLAAIAFFWRLSHRKATHAPTEAPVTTAEPPATLPTPPQAPGPPPAAAAVAAPVAAAAAPEAASPTEDQQPEMSPSQQSEMARVISDGRAGLTACYQRALTHDETLINGRLGVRVSVAPSGKVSRVRVNGPADFADVKPCLEGVISKWRFPATGASYQTVFPLALHGSE